MKFSTALRPNIKRYTLVETTQGNRIIEVISDGDGYCYFVIDWNQNDFPSIYISANVKSIFDTAQAAFDDSVETLKGSLIARNGGNNVEITAFNTIEHSGELEMIEYPTTE